VPQSLAILKAGAVALQPETRVRLEGLEYERCLAVMAELAGPSRLAPPGSLAPGDGPIGVRPTVVRAARVATEEGQRECQHECRDNPGAAPIISPALGLYLGCA